MTREYTVNLNVEDIENWQENTNVLAKCKKKKI